MCNKINKCCNSFNNEAMYQWMENEIAKLKGNPIPNIELYKSKPKKKDTYIFKYGYSIDFI